MSERITSFAHQLQGLQDELFSPYVLAPDQIVRDMVILSTRAYDLQRRLDCCDILIRYMNSRLIPGISHPHYEVQKQAFVYLVDDIAVPLIRDKPATKAN
jgi:hypothetical protein